MLRNYFRTAIRIINGSRGYSIINILGLATGMASCLLILLWVNYELSYDKFHENVDRLFRVVRFSDQEGSALTPVPLAHTLKENFAEVENATRFNIEGSQLVRYQDKSFQHDIMAIADQSFLEMFSFPFIRGDRNSALENVNSVVINEKMALKIFENEDPVGKILNINQRSFMVTGVMKNVPANSHIRFDYIAHFDSRNAYLRQLTDNRWDVSAYYTYVLLSENVRAGQLRSKFNSFINQYTGETNQDLQLQEISNIHLHPEIVDYLEGHNEIKYVYLFSGLAALILVIACINFTNLTTARASLRAKEIGLRKVMGARRSDLVRQFLGESVLLALFALLIASLMVETMLPALSAWSGKNLVIDYNDIGKILITLGALIIAVGLIAGSYPALLLSSFQPVKILKGNLLHHGDRGLFRKILVVIQFSCSIFLVIGTIVIHQQLNYISKNDHGYDKEHTLHFTMRGSFRQNYESIKQELEVHPGILNISAGRPPSEGFEMAGSVNWPGKITTEETDVFQVAVDQNYPDLFGLDLMEGSDFSTGEISQGNSYLINETAKRMIGTDSVIGLQISFQTWNGDFIDHMGRIIGVVADFQNGSLHHRIQPVIMYVDKEALFTMNIKVSPADLDNTIKYIEQKWDQYVADYPFDYSFVDVQLDSYYQSEKKLSTLFDTFTFLAIFISGLGLFGLISHSTDRRIKEIGVRKVLGATITSILSLLVRDTIRLILIASLIAVPAAYFLMNSWLTNFAYRVSIGWTSIVMAVLSGFWIAILIVCFQGFKAASVNPVKSLRNE